MEQPNISYYVNLINIFVKHYNNSNERKIHMFENIEKMDDTNDMMEEFFEHINELKENDIEDRRLRPYDDIDIETTERLFGLKINNKIVCVCKLMIPIMEYIAKDIDWVKTDWQIVPLIMK